MPAFKIVLSYDGTDFVGWQRQAAGVSIQGLLEDALRELDDRDVPVTGAGRTDAGVHALGQVAGFSLQRALPAETVVRALNARLPRAVRVIEAHDVAPAFHARFDARSKTYRYRIWNGDVVSPFERRYAWHVAGALDVGAMEAAARMLEGRHDFAAFQTAGGEAKTTEREVFTSRVKSAIADHTLGDSNAAGHRLVEYEIAGSGFLRHMVRAIAGTLVEIGRGRRRPDWMRDVLASRDRSTGGPTAPAGGLFLVHVEYDDGVPAPIRACG